MNTHKIEEVKAVQATTIWISMFRYPYHLALNASISSSNIETEIRSSIWSSNNDKNIYTVIFQINIGDTDERT